MKRIFFTLALIVASLVSAQAQYIAPYSGAVSRTNNSKMSDILNAKDFGVLCDGITNDDTAFSTALTRAAAANKTLMLPGGACILSGNFTLPASVYISGQGEEITSLYISSTTNTLFTISGSNSATISNLRVLPVTTRTASSVYIQNDSTGYVTLNNIHFYSGGISVKTTAEGFLTYRNGHITNTVLNGIDIDIGGCFLCNIENVITLNDSAARPFANVVFRSVTGQVQFKNSTFTQGSTGWYFLPGNGQVVTLVKAEQTYIDSVGGTGFLVSPTGTGFVQRVLFVDGWISQGVTAGAQLNGNGSNIDQVSFDNVEFLNNGTYGVAATGVTRLDLLNSRFQLATTSVVLDGVVGCHIAGNYLGITSVTTGLSMVNATDKCKIENNDFGAAVTPVSNTSSGTANFFGPNVGYNPVSFPTGITTGDLLYGSAANGILSRLASAVSGGAIQVAVGGTACTSASGTCLDNITGFSSTGFIYRTGAGAYSFASPSAGKLLLNTSFTETPTLLQASAPGSPAAGNGIFWIDSTDARLHDKNPAGTIGTTVVADTGSANNFLTAVSTAGVISKAQPAFSNLSGSATLAQFPTIATNTILGNATSGTAVPTALAIGSCSTSSSAIQWTTNTGFGCNTSINAATLGGKAIGTSGNAIPLLDVANTWSGAQTFSGAASFISLSGTDASGPVEVRLTNTTAVTGMVWHFVSSNDGSFRLTNTGVADAMIFSPTTVNLAFQSTTDATSASAAAVTTLGGLGVAKKIWATDTIRSDTGFNANGTAGVTCGAGLGVNSRTTLGLVTTCGP